MDSVTHITLGACVGELVLGKKLGKQALLWGAVAQSLPDIDSAAALFVSADRALLVHRGITHSVFFAIVAGVALAFLARRIHQKVYLQFATLVLFFCFQLLLHDLLDTCNAYGTGLFEPFSHQRFSVNLLYVADPLFTIGLLTASIVLAFKNLRYKYRGRWAFTAITLSALYLCFAGFSKLYIGSRVKASFKDKQGQNDEYLTTPAPFTSMLWYVAVPANNGYYTAYSSVLDNPHEPLTYHYYHKNDSLLNQVKNKAVANNLLAFAGKYYIFTKVDSNIHINLLRFGQVQGWASPDAPFAFSYPLAATTNQKLMLQKGRLSGWNSYSFQIYLQRILGKQAVNYKHYHQN
jgi:inner membrane protein